MVHDRKIFPQSAFVREPITFGLSSVPINQAAVLFAQIILGQGLPSPFPYAMRGYQVENVQVFCTAIVATAQVDVKVGPVGSTVSVLTGLITPVAGSTVQGTLVATLATRRFGFADAIEIRPTTNGTGTLTNLMVTVTVRPFPLDNEAA